MKTTIKYFAGVCFGILAVLSLINLVESHSIEDLVLTACYILVMISLFLSMRMLSMIGCGLLAFQRLLFIIKHGKGMIAAGYSSSFVFIWGIFAVYFILLLIASINFKASKAFGIAASILAFTIFVFLKIKGLRLSPTSHLLYLLYILGAFLLGMAFDGKNEYPSENKVTNKQANPGVIESNTERLLKLKELLDRGIITREEFDAKKKEILGL